MPVLKVKNNGVWEDVAGASGHTHTVDDIVDFPSNLSSGADWAQNDPTAPDYIKNRTHYEGEQIVLFENDAVQFENDGGGDGYIVTVEIPITVGKMYEVTIDGVSTRMTCPDTGYLSIDMDGNNSYDMTISNNTGYLYCYCSEQGNSDHIHSMKISEVGELKQLDEKFIPDTIARRSDIACTTADNGKFLCVVNGVPTWTAVTNAEEVTY